MSGNPLDLRAWLAEVDKLGELRDVRGADWNLELGAISELNVKKDVPPALLFDEIKGYPKGFRVLTCSTSSPARLSSILRLDDTTYSQGPGGSAARQAGAMAGRGAQIRPRGRVDPGPFSRTSRKTPDLLAFPSPLWHEMDGGRYIGTGCSVVTNDLDSDWVNVGTYRVQLHDKNHVALDMVPGKHGASSTRSTRRRASPSRWRSSSAAIRSAISSPASRSRSECANRTTSVRSSRSQVAVLKGQVTGLPFPAASEIVLEGFVEPNDERTEGPFGEFHGYYPGKAGTAPCVTIERIYYRNDPIMVGSPPAKPPNDYSYSKAVMRSALLLDALVAAGVPDVKSVWAHEIGGARMFNVVAIKQRYAGHARQAGHILNQCGVGAYMSRYSVVVDDDIDPSNLQEVMWAVATRTDPAVDIDIIQPRHGLEERPDVRRLPVRRAVQLQGDHRRLPAVRPPRRVPGGGGGDRRSCRKKRGRSGKTCCNSGIRHRCSTLTFVRDADAPARRGRCAYPSP